MVSRKSTIKRCVAAIIVAGLFLWSGRVPRAQDAQTLTRLEDEKLASREQREAALTSILNAATEARAAGDSSTAAALLNRAGRLQFRLHQPQIALATFREVRTLLGDSNSTPAYVDSLNGSGAVYNDLSNCEEATAEIEKARDLSERTNYIAGKAEALLLRSDCQNYTNPELAIVTARESLRLFESVNDRLGMAKAHEAVGHYLLAQTNLVESTENHEASLKIFQELNIVSEQAEALINLGFVEYRKGAWEASLSLLTQAQAMLDERAEPYKMGQINGGLGEAFLESGLPEVALSKMQLSLEYFREAQNPRGVGFLLWDLGRAYYELRRYPESIESLQRALADAEKINDQYLAALSSEHLGRTYAAMANANLAVTHLKNAFRGYDKLDKKMERARTDALIGQAYMQEGRIKEAQERLHAALTTFDKLVDHVNGSATLYALGKLELDQNNLDAAEDYLRRSLEVTENIRRVSTSLDLTTAFSAAVDDRYRSYIDCLMRQHKADPSKNFDVRAFEASESSRGRALAEMLKATGESFAPGVDKSLIESENSIRSSLRVKEDYKVTLLAGNYKTEDLAALEAEISALEKQHAQIVERIEASFPAFKQITHPQSLNLRQIQEQVIVDDQTLLLEFSLGEHQSYVWAVTRNSLASYELPSATEIGKQAESLYKQLKTPPGAGDHSLAETTVAARNLAQTVLAPVAAELKKRRVIVVAHRVLNYVPFQLLANPNDGEPLIARHEIINAPSASILGGLREPSRTRGSVLAAFGSPVFESNYSIKANNSNVQIASLQTVEQDRWKQAARDIELQGDALDPSTIQPLFYAARELANLRDVVGERESMIAIDFDASRDKLLNTDLTQYSILHFATHGYLDPDRPENSGLIFSTITRDGNPQNGFLTLSDVYRLRAPVSLVVLSACQTGLGKDVRGEGLIGLTRGFMYAGASSVVASLWKVDDEATAELMKVFYQNMFEQGMTPAAALREAQNSFRRHPVWSAPYYWAGFTLQGDYRQVITHQRSYQQYLVAVVGVLLVILGGSWFYLRRAKRNRSTK